MSTDTLALDYARTIAEGITELTQRDNWQDFDGEQWSDAGEPLTLGTWLDDALDIEVTTGANGDYRGARVLVTFGGPNAWINTRQQQAEVYWGSDSATQIIPVEFCDLLDTYLEEVSEAN